jgi:hypothetical protein
MLKKMPFLLFGYVIFVQYYQDLKNKIRTFPGGKIKYRAIIFGHLKE